MKLKIIFTIFLLASVYAQATAQTANRRRPFQGEWHWAVYAKDKSELPPAYQSMELHEVPAYALDLTLKQRGNRVTGSYGILARYLARVDQGTFTVTAKGRTLNIRLRSNFGGTATVTLSVNSDTLTWQAAKTSGENYFPRDIVLRRLKHGEKPPYVAEDENPNL